MLDFLFSHFYLSRRFFELQVLTMEYVPGIKINRIQALDQLGVDRKKYTYEISLSLKYFDLKLYKSYNK